LSIDLEASIDDCARVSAGLNLNCISWTGFKYGSRNGLSIATVARIDDQDARLD